MAVHGSRRHGCAGAPGAIIHPFTTIGERGGVEAARSGRTRVLLAATLGEAVRLPCLGRRGPAGPMWRARTVEIGHARRFGRTPPSRSEQRGIMKTAVERTA